MAKDNIYNQILLSMLESLAKSRIEKKAWKDAEEESSGTQVYKIGESIRPFFLYSANNPTKNLLLNQHILKSDTEFFFKTIMKDGFFPSPYSPVETKDQYTELAAFSLDFSSIYLKWAKDKRTVGNKWTNLNGLVEDVARKSFNFLVNVDNYLENEQYVRWGGTNVPTRTGKLKVIEYFTDTYFTSVVVLALVKSLEHPTLNITVEEKDKVNRLITKAGSWIIDRADQGLLTGDEKKTKKNLIYTAWGLRALAESYDLHQESLRSEIKSIVAGFLNELDKISDSGPISITQDYFYIFSQEVDTVLSYDDRSSWGGVILALLSLVKINDLQILLEECSYQRILDTIFNGVMGLRDTATDTWYKEFPILSFHSYMAEALLNLQYGKDTFRYSFEVSSALVARTIQEAINDPRVLKTLQQVFYEKLERNARAKAQGDLFLK